MLPHAPAIPHTGRHCFMTVATGRSVRRYFERRSERDATAWAGERVSAAFATTGPRLCVVSNDQKGRIYPLTTQLSIGRGATNEIVTADPRASRVHATIEQLGGAGRWGH